MLFRTMSSESNDGLIHNDGPLKRTMMLVTVCLTTMMMVDTSHAWTTSSSIITPRSLGAFSTLKTSSSYSSSGSAHSRASRLEYSFSSFTHDDTNGEHDDESDATTRNHSMRRTRKRDVLYVRTTLLFLLVDASYLVSTLFPHAYIFFFVVL